jgi:capsular polysaccharide biosynthesis protein
MYGWDGILYHPLLSVKPLATDNPIVSCPPTGYFHWLLERMPVLLQALSLVPGAQILIPKKPPAYLLNALELLFGPQELKKRLIVAGKPVSVASLVMPRLEIHSGFVHPHDIQLLRNAFKTKVPFESAGRDAYLYVSRSKAPRRRLGNEQTLEEKLSSIGFRIVHAEEMSFQDQIAVFSKARFIVAPHGAGLSNIVWADSPCRILEIFPSEMSNDCYARLAVSLGLEYDYVVCEADVSSSGRIRIADVLERVTASMAAGDTIRSRNVAQDLDAVVFSPSRPDYRC